MAKKTPEIIELMKALKKECLEAERNGNFKTAHHEVLAGYEKEYGKLDEVKENTDNGK